MNIIDVGLKFNGLTYGNNPQMIILHHAEASHCSVQDIHQWHLQRGWAGIGYQYFVRKDSSIYKGRPENAIGAHTIGFNSNSIGICAEGAYMTEDMPEVQKQAIISLVKDIIARHGIKQVYGHKEKQSTDCPGIKYPLQNIKDLSFKTEIERKLDNMNTLDLQKFLNKLGVTDYEGKALVEDGSYGPRTDSAKKKAAELLHMILG